MCKKEYPSSVATTKQNGGRREGDIWKTGEEVATVADDTFANDSAQKKVGEVPREIFYK